MSAPAPDLTRLKIDRDAPPVVRGAFRTTLIIAGAAVVLVAAVLLYFLRQSVPEVETVVVTAGSAGSGGAGGTAVTANGYVVARTRAAVSAKLAGRLAELRVSEGSSVRRGDVLARIENSEYQAQVARADANLGAARAQQAKAKAEHQQLAREAERMREIRAQNPELLSLQDYEAAASRATQAAARVRSVVAQVAAAEAELNRNRANLENTLVRAPFNGTVLRKEAEVGEVVAPGGAGLAVSGDP